MTYCTAGSILLPDFSDVKPMILYNFASVSVLFQADFGSNMSIRILTPIGLSIEDERYLVPTSALLLDLKVKLEL